MYKIHIVKAFSLRGMQTAMIIFCRMSKLIKFALLWNQQIIAVCTISANKPNEIVKNPKYKRCLVIDLATPADRNVITKGTEKI